MLTIRLQRTGRKNNPTYRVIVVDSKRGPKTGNALEVVGSYEPKKGVREFKNERVLHWLSKGAQTSGTIHNMLIDAKLLEGKKINVLPKKKPIVKESTAAPEAAAPVAAAAEAAPAEVAPEVVAEAPAETPVQETEAPAEAAPETPAEAPSEEAAA